MQCLYRCTRCGMGWLATMVEHGDCGVAEGVSHVLAPSEGSSKLIPINEKSNDQIVHLFRLGKAQRTTH